MDWGYKSLIVTMVVCASWYKTKASAASNDKVKADSSIIENHPAENNIVTSSKVYHINKNALYLHRQSAIINVNLKKAEL